MVLDLKIQNYLIIRYEINKKINKKGLIIEPKGIEILSCISLTHTLLLIF